MLRLHPHCEGGAFFLFVENVILHKEVMVKKKNVDWEKIEIDYRAGVKTLREIASSHDISHVAISKRAKRDGWSKDLSARIKAKAQDLVNRMAVSNKVNKGDVNRVVDVNAKLQSDIILEHRKNIPKKRALVTKLFKEVEALTDEGDIVEQMTLALHSADMGKLAEVAKKISSLPSRVKCTSELITALKSVIALERQAFGIDDKPHGGGDSEQNSVVILPAKV